MHLPRDFDKAARCIQVLTDGVLGHRFDHGIDQSLVAKVSQCVLNQLPAEPLAAEIGGDGQVGDPPFASRTIDDRRDVADDRARPLRDKNSRRVRRDVFIDVAGLAPLPIVTTQHTQRLFDILFERHTVEGSNGQLFDGHQICGPIGADLNRRISHKNTVPKKLGQKNWDRILVILTSVALAADRLRFGVAMHCKFISLRSLTAIVSAVTMAAFVAAAPAEAVRHTPQQPKAGQAVTIVVPGDVISKSVQLQWQAVPPGEYVRRTDAAYDQNWRTIAGRRQAPNFIFEIPGEEIKHRWLYRYRVLITQADGTQIVLPDPKATVPNFAFFCYDGLPEWSGAREPGKTPARKFSASFLNTIKPYHLIARGEDIATSQWDGGAHKKRFPGTFVYDGVVYDHIAFTNRGQGSAYISGKNKWALKFNKEQPVPLRNNRGERYRVPWNGVDLNPGTHTPYIPVHRGIAGLDEAVTFRAYQLAGVPSSSTHWVHFRVIDGAAESNPKDQYDGDLWGLYLAIADLDQEILNEQKLPDGLIVSIQSGLKHLPADMSAGQKEWDLFRGGMHSNSPEDWWRKNLDLPKYFSFHSLNRLMGNVDIRPDGNHGYYRAPDGKWSPLPWDNDMCFVPRHHQPGHIDAIRCLDHANIKREYQNRAREILDLFCADATPTGGQIGQLVQELARVLSPPGFETNWAQLDEAMWNWHPRFQQKGSFFVNPAYGDHFGGRWERKLATNDLPGFEKYLLEFCTDSRPVKNYQPNDGNPLGYGWGYVAHEAQDKEIPPRPVVQRAGRMANDRLYTIDKVAWPAGKTPRVEWRVGRIGANVYELEEHWRAGPAASERIAIPAKVFGASGAYRVRARYHDSTGRASHWSEAVVEVVK